MLFFIIVDYCLYSVYLMSWKCFLTVYLLIFSSNEIPYLLCGPLLAMAFAVGCTDVKTFGFNCYTTLNLT